MKVCLEGALWGLRYNVQVSVDTRQSINYNQLCIPLLTFDSEVFIYGLPTSRSFV